MAARLFTLKKLGGGPGGCVEDGGPSGCIDEGGPSGCGGPRGCIDDGEPGYCNVCGGCIVGGPGNGAAKFDPDKLTGTEEVLVMVMVSFTTGY